MYGDSSHSSILLTDLAISVRICSILLETLRSAELVYTKDLDLYSVSLVHPNPRLLMRYLQLYSISVVLLRKSGQEDMKDLYIQKYSALM